MFDVERIHKVWLFIISDYSPLQDINQQNEQLLELRALIHSKRNNVGKSIPFFQNGRKCIKRGSFISVLIYMPSLMCRLRSMHDQLIVS